MKTERGERKQKKQRGKRERREGGKDREEMERMKSDFGRELQNVIKNVHEQKSQDKIKN